MLPLGTVLDCSISSEVGKVHIDIAGQTEGTCHSAHAFSHYQSPRPQDALSIPTTRPQRAHLTSLNAIIVKSDHLTRASLRPAHSQILCTDSPSVPWLNLSILMLTFLNKHRHVRYSYT